MQVSIYFVKDSLKTPFLNKYRITVYDSIVTSADMPTFGVSKEGDEILVGSGGVLPPGNFWSSVMAFPAL
jgi:hypothetical protein